MNRSNTVTGVMQFRWGMGNPIDMEARRLEMELKMRNRGKDPELPPHKEPGDFYILLGLLIGIILGGLIGLLIPVLELAPDTLVFLLIIAGAIAGGIIGVTIGSALKKRKLKIIETTQKENPFTDD